MKQLSIPFKYKDGALRGTVQRPIYKLNYNFQMRRSYGTYWSLFDYFCRISCYRVDKIKLTAHFVVVCKSFST